MIRARQTFFDDHPDAMWVFDQETLNFLDVNNAAMSKYGYSHAEFLDMSLEGLHPKEDIPDLLPTIAKLSGDRDEVGHARHVLKSGEIIDVSLVICSVDFEGRAAKLAAVRDITAIVALERKARSVAAVTAQKFVKFFEAIPGKCAVVAAGTHEILAASDAYLAAGGVRRNDVIGRNLFDVFPDWGAGSAVTGVKNLKASFRRVEMTGIPDTLPLQRYAIERKTEDGLLYDERFWSVVNIPIQSEGDCVDFIVHRVEEVTLLVNAARAVGVDATAAETFADPIVRLNLEVMLRAEELKIANTRLMDQAANLRTAQRLLAIGFFRHDLVSDTTFWSDNVYELFGVDKASFGHDAESYTKLIDPRDRDAIRAHFEQNMALGTTPFEFSHRIVRPSGGVILVNGVCEIVEDGHHKFLSGVFHDMTSELDAKVERQQALSLARFAGHLANLGGWRLDLNPMKIHWSPEVAAIHERPDLRSPDLDDALNYYAPEYRSVIRTALQTCINDGLPFDELCEMITAKGNRIWVRAIGEAQRDTDGTIVAVQGAFKNVTAIVDARKATDALERRLTRTVAGMSEAFMTLDTEWRYTFLNAQAEKLLQRGRSSLLGNFIWDAFPQGRDGFHRKEFERAVETQTPVHFKAHFPDPLNIWLDLSVNPFPDGVAVYFRDVTGEERKSQQLRLLEASVSQINDIVIITEAAPLTAPHGPKIVYVNESFTRKTGFLPEEAIGRTPRILQGPGTDKATLEKVGIALWRGEPIKVELLNYTKAGVEYWNEIAISPVTDTLGEITHYVAVQRDVTQRKTAEQTLRVSEERFRLVAATSSAVVKDIDLVSQSVWMTENKDRYLGEQTNTVDAFMRSWRARIHPDDVDWVMAKFEAALTTGLTAWQDQYRLITPTGQTAIVADRAYFIRDEAGQPLRIIGSLVDVTAEQQDVARKLQSQKLEAMGQLTGGVAHDFNNLLTIILGNTEILVQNSESEELRRIAAATTKAAEHAAALTARLLAFSRQHPMEPKTVAVNDLVASMEDLVCRSLGENIEIILNLGDDAGLIKVDPSQLEVSLLNLAVNARDAMPSGGKLIVETSNITVDPTTVLVGSDFAAGDYVLLQVTDTGTGMTPQVVERVFEPFFSTKEVGMGSGLGLSMVYGFVKQSGGYIAIYSEVGVGTSFKLYLPRVHLQVPEANVSTARPDVVRGTEHILVVEDDILVREHLVGQLASLGYKVSQATNGKDGMAVLLSRDDIDMLLTDVVMPGDMDGHELAETALLRLPDLKILLTSGYTRHVVTHTGRLGSHFELLSKPYRRQELASKIRKVLDS